MLGRNSVSELPIFPPAIKLVKLIMLSDGKGEHLCLCPNQAHAPYSKEQDGIDTSEQAGHSCCMSSPAVVLLNSKI